MSSKQSILPGAGHMALTRLLQKYLKKFVETLPKIETSEKSAKTQVASLANLIEQRNCLLKSDKENVLLSQFPDLQSRLLVKVSAEIDKKKYILKEYCDYLGELHTLALKGYNEATTLCKKYQHDLEFEALHNGEATTPPLHVMLTWLVALENHLREQYFSRCQYLENLGNREIVMPDTLQHIWVEDFDRLLNILYDSQEQCKYFFNEKFT